MAMSAFKSTTKRTLIANSSTSSAEDSSSSNRGSSVHRRSRSLSRFSHRIPTNVDDFSDKLPAPTRGRFVNKVRESEFPEISLDDLAIRFLNSADRGGSASRFDDVSPSDKASVSHRRGRSASRHGSRAGVGKANGGNIGGGGSVNQECNSRRRRSVSVVRRQISDSSESDLDHPQNSRKQASLKSFDGGRSQLALSNKNAASDHRQGLLTSLSQKDLKYHHGYSSQSSVLTDDDGRDRQNNKNALERTIRAVYSQNKAERPTGDDTNSELYEAMRKELRHAVQEIKMELEQAMGKTKTPLILSHDCSQPRSSLVRRKYTSQLEQPQKLKQHPLAEVLEEQRSRELAKIVKKLLPQQDNASVEKPLQTRKKSNDRNRMSRRLTEEAERYIEDFICNIEDTDISSWDGERSDASSSIGITKMEPVQTPPICKPLVAEMDGVTLPWLQWETSNDPSPPSGKNTVQTATSNTKLWDGSQEARAGQDVSTRSISSHGSWVPGVTDSRSSNTNEIARIKSGNFGSYLSQFSLCGTRTHFDIDKYLKHQSDEDFLFERWRQQQRTHSGGLLLCNHMFF